jgi:hypothetical protein
VPRVMPPLTNSGSTSDELLALGVVGAKYPGDGLGEAVRAVGQVDDGAPRRVIIKRALDCDCAISDAIRLCQVGRSGDIDDTCGLRKPNALRLNDRLASAQQKQSGENG